MIKHHLKAITTLGAATIIIVTGIAAYMLSSKSSNFEYENDIQISPSNFRWKTKVNKK